MPILGGLTRSNTAKAHASAPIAEGNSNSALIDRKAKYVVKNDV